MFHWVVLPALLLTAFTAALPSAQAQANPHWPPTPESIARATGQYWMDMNTARVQTILRGMLRDTTMEVLVPLLEEQLQQLGAHRFTLPMTDISIDDPKTRARTRSRAINTQVRALANSIDTDRSILGREMFLHVPGFRDTMIETLLEKVRLESRTSDFDESVIHLVTSVMENSLQIELANQIAFTAHTTEFRKLSAGLRTAVIERILAKTYHVLAGHLVSVLGEVTLALAFDLPFAPPSSDAAITARCKAILTPKAAAQVRS